MWFSLSYAADHLNFSKFDLNFSKFDTKIFENDDLFEIFNLTLINLGTVQRLCTADWAVQSYLKLSIIDIQYDEYDMQNGKYDNFC